MTFEFDHQLEKISRMEELFKQIERKEESADES